MKAFILGLVAAVFASGVAHASLLKLTYHGNELHFFAYEDYTPWPGEETLKPYTLTYVFDQDVFGGSLAGRVVEFDTWEGAITPGLVSWRGDGHLTIDRDTFGWIAFDDRLAVTDWFFTARGDWHSYWTDAGGDILAVDDTPEYEAAVGTWSSEIVSTPLPMPVLGLGAGLAALVLLRLGRGRSGVKQRNSAAPGPLLV